jgi:nucleotide-binding universal stress UspA family protein
VVRKDKLFEKILVAVDGSKQASSAAQLAARLAKEQGGELVVLHVVDRMVIEELGKFMGHTPKALEEELKEQAWALLRSTEILLKKYGVPLRLVLEEGIPHQQILDTAKEEKVDLIVMGRLGKRGVKKVLMGSAVFRVLEFSTTPVLVVD